MAFDYDGAKKAGYTDAEIADHLAKQYKFDADGARKSGYSDSELIKHLTTMKPKVAPTVAAKTPVTDDPVFNKLDGAMRGIGRTADDLVRAAANGLTFGWADRLAAGGNAAINNTIGDGTQSYASNVKQERQQSADAQKRNPYVYKGVEIGSGFVLPGASLVRGASTGAQVANAAGNGALFGALGGAGMESGDTDPLKALSNAGVGAGTGAAIGAVATPLVNKGLELASRFSPKVDQALTQGAIARNYKGNPNAAVDAEITRDLGFMSGAKSKGLQAKELNDLGNGYIAQAEQQAKNAGLLGDVEKRSIDNYLSLAARPEDIAKLQSTTEGQAILDILNKAKRTSELTQAAEANNSFFPKVGRTVVDSGILDAAIMGSTGIPVPIATAARQGLKKAMGGNSTRAEVAAGLTTDRGLKAANQFLETAGPSDATKGLGILQQSADDVLAREMAVGRETAVAKRTVLEEAQRAAEAKAAEAAAKQAEKEAIREGGAILKERKAAEAAKTVKPAADPNLSISELQATDPTYLLGLSNPNGVPRNARQMQEFSDVMRAQMEAPVKAQAKANAGILDQVSQEAGVVNRSGPLQTLDAGFGLDEAGMDKVLTDLVSKRPALKSVIDSLYQPGASLADNGLLKLSDIIKKEAGLKFTKPQPQATPGMLSQAPGMLSEGAPNVSRTIFNLTDDQVTALLGRNSDTLGGDIGNAKGYLTTRASRALKTFQESPDSVPEADMALLKQLGLI